MSTSFILNEASSVQYLISPDVIKSIPPPMQYPCIPTRTGRVQSYNVLIDFYQSLIRSYKIMDLRAPSKLSGNYSFL
jgi:hypothetical protein